jgi:hypothetical protein
LEFWHSEIGSSTLGRRATKPNFFLPRKSGWWKKQRREESRHSPTLCALVCTYVCLFVCLFLCFFVYLFVCFYVCMFWFVSLFVCFYVCYVFCLFIHMCFVILHVVCLYFLCMCFVWVYVTPLFTTSSVYVCTSLGELWNSQIHLSTTYKMNLLNESLSMNVFQVRGMTLLPSSFIKTLS